MVKPAEIFNTYEAKRDLSALLARVEGGEEVVIARAGKPIARLIPEPPAKLKPRQGGFLKGKIWIADDFDAPLPDELQKAFEGEGT